MATCKDCIHEKVCDALIKRGCPWLEEECSADKFCFEFKNKADVVEVVRGEWKMNTEQDFECSVCKRISEYDTLYCSKCGAKMKPFYTEKEGGVNDMRRSSRNWRRNYSVL